MVQLCIYIYPIGSTVLLYMVLHGSHQYTPFMLAYIPAPWILWVMQLFSNSVGPKILIHKTICVCVVDRVILNDSSFVWWKKEV